MHSTRVLHTFGLSTFWLWLDRGALRVGNAAAGLLLIRYLGPTNFGVYVTALACGELLAATLNFGLNMRAARDAGVQQDRGKSIVAAYLMIAGIAFIFQVALLAVAVALKHWQLAAISAGFLLANCEYTASFFRAVLTSDLRASATLGGSILSGVGTLIVAACVIFFKLSSLGLLIGLSARALPVVIMRFYQVREHWPEYVHCRWTNVRQTIVESWKYYSCNLVAVGYQRAPIVLLGIVASSSDVGLFGAALTLAYIYPLWSDAWNEAVLPLLTRLYEFRRYQELIQLRQQIFDLLLFVSIPIAVFMSAFAPQVCMIFGARFAGSALILTILAYRCVLSILDGFIGQAFLTAIGRVPERRNIQVSSLVVLALLTLSLGYVFGALGAAVSLFIADLLLFFPSLRVCKSAGLAIGSPALWPSVRAGLAMAFAAIYAPVDFWPIRALIASLVYALFLFVSARHQLLRAGDTLRECAGMRRTILAEI